MAFRQPNVGKLLAEANRRRSRGKKDKKKSLSPLQKHLADIQRRGNTASEARQAATRQRRRESNTPEALARARLGSPEQQRINAENLAAQSVRDADRAAGGVPGGPGGGGVAEGTEPSFGALAGLQAAGGAQQAQPLPLDLPSPGLLGAGLGRRTPNAPSLRALSGAGGRIF
ncbi:hypothetical protein LCGC14_0521050 [marine sediment metagenome]|uniref:Uncharacterized protein n=1 Tax=marine sediment metagenome TaxID=412755 RepID=A0A0F9SGW1_9ZZZZ